jgi:hypothetical protein
MVSLVTSDIALNILSPILGGASSRYNNTPSPVIKNISLYLFKVTIYKHHLYLF